MRKLYFALIILLFCQLRLIAQKVISAPIQKPVSTFIAPALPKIRITQPKVPVIGVFGNQGIPLLMDNGGTDGGGGGGTPPPGCNVTTGEISGGGVSVCVGTNSTTLTLINSQFADTYQWESSTDNS